MGKWLAAIGAVILVVLVLLWRELDSSSADPVKPAVPSQVASVPSPSPSEVQPAEVKLEAKPVAAAVEPPKDPSKEKMDPQSDEFFHKHDELVVPNLMRRAVSCWENLPAAKRGEFHRNQSMTATFKQKIRDGVVSISDIQVTGSTLRDTALEACFIQQLRNATWANARLPDWDQDDEITIGVRTLKKYTRENIEFVGPEAPRD